jgi:hypothetical protein
METKEQIKNRLRKEGYYLTEYALDNITEDIFNHKNEEKNQTPEKDKQLLQELSAIRQAMKTLNEYRLEYTINHQTRNYTQRTPIQELNQTITSLQEKILKTLKQ